MNMNDTVAIPAPVIFGLSKQALKSVLSTFFVTRFILFVVILFSMTTLPLRMRQNLYADPDNVVIDGLVRHDSWWYHNIVTRGYSMGDIETGQQGNVAFFPLYPTLVKLVAGVTGDVFFAGIFVANLAFLFALVYLYRLTLAEFDHDTASRAVFYYAAAPASIFFSAMYTESLYMALVIATFFYARQQQWLKAAVVGILASSTRNTGILLSSVIALEGVYWAGLRFTPIPLFFRNIKQNIQLIFKSWRPILAGFCVVSGILLYMTYLANTFGDPFGFITVQQTWGREISTSGLTDVLSNTIRDMGLSNGILNGRFNPIAVWDALFSFVFIILIAATAIKLRPAYFVFCLLTFLIPLSTGTVASMSRYVLMLFPCFMLLAYWGKREWVDRLIIGISLPLMAYFAILFSHWYFAG